MDRKGSTGINSDIKKEEGDLMKHNYVVLGEEPVSVVVELGLGACLSEWIPTAKLIAEHFGVLLYERSGINKSEGSTNKRAPLNIANELHELLKNINHTDKIVLIAHSQGGLYSQQFCRLYPNLVKGLILLDPLSANDNTFKECLSAKEYQQSGVDKSGNLKLMHTLATLKLGFITKMLLRKAPPFYYYNGYEPAEVKDILDSACKPMHSKVAYEEYEEAHVSGNVESLKSGKGFPDIPLILITHSSSMAVEDSIQFGNNTREFATKVEEIWQKIMKEYLEFSAKAVWKQAEHSTHFIHLTEPELIITALGEIKKLS